MLRNEIKEIVGTTPANDFIETQRLRCVGYINRMKHNQLTARAFYMKTSRYRAKERPWKRWIDGVNETLSKYNITTAKQHTSESKNTAHSTSLRRCMI